MRESVEILVLAVLLICFGREVKSDAFNHRYKAGDQVPFYANKVGPYHNPIETYAFFDLPFCSPGYVKEKKLTLGEVLNGDRLVSAPYKLDFLVEKDSEVVCRKRLTKEDVSKFHRAVVEDYYMQLYYDDLPMWAFIGQSYRDQSKNGYFIYTHIHFEVFYNKDRVIKISARTDPQLLADLSHITDEEVEVEFRYSVKWKETATPFEKRMEMYRHSSYLPHHQQIHWFSVMYSSATILILIVCLGTFYIRVLKKDIIKYLDAQLAENQEEKGWKYLHGDVFRYPKNKCLFVAAVGCGTQLLTLMALIITLGLADVFYPCNRGFLMTALVLLYAFTSGVAGYTSVSFYRQLEGTNWVKNLLMTGCLFCGPLFLAFCFLNSVAISYRATAALPFGTLVVIFLIWTFLAMPMLLLGGITGKNSNSEFQAPCPTMKCPREVPSQRWYKGILPQMALGGILPFSVLYVELYYVFASVWGLRVYTLYSILFIVFIILLIATALVTVALTYIQLAGENHEWWWRSFLYGGSTSFYIYGFCLYYYFARSDMNGFMQTSFFFGYMACICYGIFLVLGTVGFHASLLFVRFIYGSIKCD